MILRYSLVGFVAVVVSLATLIGCNNGNSNPDTSKTTVGSQNVGKAQGDWKDFAGPKVVASFPPIYCFALNIAGDDAFVKTVLTSQGVHGSDNVQTKDVKILNAADLFLINGLGLDEKLANRLKGGAANEKLKIVELAERIDEKLLEAMKHEEHEGHGDDGHDHGTHDPHVWLGLDLAIIEVEAIRDELKALDPAHAEGYAKRTTEYVAKLKKLKEEGTELLKDKKDRSFVTFHESLSYFARTFNLKIADVIQKTPGAEPNGKLLAQLVKSCLDKKVRIIAVEPQYSSQGSAKRVLDELKNGGIADAELVEIDPLETAQESDLSRDWYEKKMRANFEALAKALK